MLSDSGGHLRVFPDDVAGGFEHFLLLCGEFQLDDLLNSVSTDPAGDSAVDSSLSVFPIQQDGGRENALLISENAGGHFCQRPSDSKFRGTFPFNDIHAGLSGLPQNDFLVKMEGFERKPSEGDC